MLHCVSVGSRLVEHGVLALHHHTRLFGRLLIPGRAVLVLGRGHLPLCQHMNPTLTESLPSLGRQQRRRAASARGAPTSTLQEGVRSTAGCGGCWEVAPEEGIKAQSTRLAWQRPDLCEWPCLARESMGTTCSLPDAWDRIRGYEG